MLEGISDRFAKYIAVRLSIPTKGSVSALGLLATEYYDALVRNGGKLCAALPARRSRGPRHPEHISWIARAVS